MATTAYKAVTHAYGSLNRTGVLAAISLTFNPGDTVAVDQAAELAAKLACADPLVRCNSYSRAWRLKHQGTGVERRVVQVSFDEGTDLLATLSPWDAPGPIFTYRVLSCDVVGEWILDDTGFHHVTP